MRYVTRNLKEIWCNEKATLELLEREHLESYKHMFYINCDLVE